MNIAIDCEIQVLKKDVGSPAKHPRRCRRAKFKFMGTLFRRGQLKSPFGPRLPPFSTHSAAIA